MNRKTLIKMIVLLACLLCCAITAVAVPAKPGWHIVTQSDGTTLKVQIVGDEITGTVLTRDGLAVERGSDGDLYYFLSSTGLSDVRAHEVGERTAREMAFIKEQQDNLKNVPDKKRSRMDRQNMFRVGGSNAEAGIPAQGVRRVPVILVEYTDIKFKNTREAIIQAMFTGNESVGQYFRDQSNGLYQPEFDVYGIYTLSQKREYYGAHSTKVNDIRLREMVSEGIRLAAADGVSFRPYDTDNDNYCDIVIVLYAGVGEASASATHPESIWPCHWNLENAFKPSSGDVNVKRFAVINELAGNDDNATDIAGIGTFAHEFSHGLGLPDLYDVITDSTHIKQPGMGNYEIMASGNWNNSGKTPVGYSAYEKVFMGWTEYVIAQQDTYYTLPVWNKKSATTDKAVYIESSLNPNEYFILENRKKQGWDKYIPGQGIMITHVTYVPDRWTNNKVNTEEIQLMTIMSACSNFSNSSGDLWPNDNKNNHDFTDCSNPPAKLNLTANGALTGDAGYLSKPVTGMVLNADSTASFWYCKHYNFSVNGIYYRFTGDNTVEVTFYSANFISYSGSVTIPSSVTWGGDTYSVTAIGSSAFQNCSNLSSVTIPNSVRSIGQYAFANCSGLTSVTCLATTPPTMGSSSMFDSNVYSNATLYVPNGCYSAYHSAAGWRNFAHIQGVFNINGFHYVTTGSNTVQVTSFDEAYVPSSGTLSIPVSVRNNNTNYNVTSIGDRAFYDCDRINKILISNNIISIGTEAFKDCDALQVVECLASTPPTMGSNVFDSDAYNGHAVLLVYNASMSAYKAATGWKNFNYVEPIYDFVLNGIYYNITGSSTVEVTYGQRDFWNGTYNVNTYAGNVTIPSNVTHSGKTYTVTAIGNHAFDFTFANDYNPDAEALKSVTIPNTVTRIGTYAFAQCLGLTSMTIGTSVTSIQDRAFTQCPLLSDVMCLATTPPTMSNSNVFDAATYSGAVLTVPRGSKITYQNANWWKNFSTILERGYDFVVNNIYYYITGTNTVEVSYKDTNYNSYSGSVTIPSSVSNGGKTYTVTAIGEAAFRESSGLTSVTIPTSVTSIGEQAFDICTGLTSVTIPNSVTTLGMWAFDGCSNLSSITLSNSLQTINDFTFFACNRLTSIVIPNSVTTIGYRVFYNCNRLKYVTIPASVTSIGDGSFTNCVSLSIVTCQGTTPPTISSGTFMSTHYSSTTLKVPRGYKSIYQVADGWKNFTIIQEPTYSFVVDDIYYYITGTNAVEVTFRGRSYIPYSGFVTIPGSVTYNGVTYTVNRIATLAFMNCTGLTSVEIPASVASIGEEAFYDCTALTSVICLGTTPPAMGASKVFSTTTYSSATLYVPKGRKSAYQAVNWWKNFAHIQEPSYSFVVNGIYYSITGSNTVEVTFKDINYNSYNGYLTIPGSVTYNGMTYAVTAIGDRAFYGSTQLYDVKIPNTVMTIGQEAFYGCVWLDEVTLPGSLTSIGSRAFADQTLYSVNCFASTPPILGSNVFDSSTYSQATLTVREGSLSAYQVAAGWKNFTRIEGGLYDFVVDGIYYSITGANTVAVTFKDTEYNTYSGSMTIPGSATYEGSTYTVTAIGPRAFRDCFELTTLNIPSTVTTIGDAAFAGCIRLRDVTIGNSVSTIGEYAFADCLALTSVTCLASTPPSMGASNVFDDATYSSATLKVPRDRMYYYRNANWWKNFSSIVANVQPGDVDGDGEVGIGDIADLIDMILSGTATIGNCPAADVDGDGSVNIGDVSDLIDMLLGN